MMEWANLKVRNNQNCVKHKLLVILQTNEPKKHYAKTYYSGILPILSHSTKIKN